MRDPNKFGPKLRGRVTAMKQALQDWEIAVDVFGSECQKMDDAEAAGKLGDFHTGPFAGAALAVLDAEEKCFKASRRLERAMQKHSLSARTAPVSEARQRLADMGSGVSE